MAPNVTARAFKWTGRSDRAAVLVAEDLKTDEQIAEEVGVSKRQLERWKLEPDFAARVRGHRGELQAAVVAEGISRRENRVAALNDRWQRLQRVIEARADELQDVP